MDKKVKLNVYSQNGEATSTISVSASVFGGEVNEQVMFNALKSALANLGHKNIYVVDGLKVNGQTKEIVALLKALKLENKKVLLVSDDDLVLRASNNVANLTLRANSNISVYDLLNTHALILNKDDVNKIEEELK